jgi:hypothetical protein
MVIAGIAGELIFETSDFIEENGNSSGGGQKRAQKSSKNLHDRPGSLLKNLAV